MKFPRKRKMIQTCLNQKDEKENNSLKSLKSLNSLNSLKYINSLKCNPGLSEQQIRMLNLFRIVIFNDSQLCKLEKESLIIKKRPSKLSKSQGKEFSLKNKFNIFNKFNKFNKFKKIKKPETNFKNRRNYCFLSEEKMDQIKSLIKSKKEFDTSKHSLGSKVCAVQTPIHQIQNYSNNISAIFQNDRIKSQVNNYLLLRKSKTQINQINQINKISLPEKHKVSKNSSNYQIKNEKCKIKRLCDCKSVIEMISKNSEKILINKISCNKDPYIIINRKPIYSHQKAISMFNSSSNPDKLNINQSSYLDI